MSSKSSFLVGRSLVLQSSKQNEDKIDKKNYGKRKKDRNPSEIRPIWNCRRPREEKTHPQYYKRKIFFHEFVDASYRIIMDGLGRLVLVMLQDHLSYILVISFSPYFPISGNLRVNVFAERFKRRKKINFSVCGENRWDLFFLRRMLFLCR